jgi:hypothetical protein
MTLTDFSARTNRANLSGARHLENKFPPLLCLRRSHENKFVDKDTVFVKLDEGDMPQVRESERERSVCGCGCAGVSKTITDIYIYVCKYAMDVVA